MSKVKVGVVGYGVVGKRVVDAVALQEDMELVGVADVVPSALIKVASERGYPIFSALPERRVEMDRAGFSTAGVLEDLLNKIDVVVDAGPEGVPGRNFPKYENAGVKFICHGGEKHNLTGFSFSALANYEEALGVDKLRVVSCNTTALCRVLSTLKASFGINKAFVAIVRRGADPVRTADGPINGIIPVLGGLSHHAPDVNTVIADLDITSMAVAVSQTLAHVHILNIKLRGRHSKEEVVELFRRTPRIILISGREGIISNAHVIELFRDKLRPRNDVWEVAVWEDSISIEEETLYLMMCVHMECVAIPETIDAIRAMTKIETNKMNSIFKTDSAMGFAKDKSCYQ